MVTQTRSLQDYRVVLGGGGMTTENFCLLCRLLNNGQSLATVPPLPLSPRASPVPSPLWVPRFGLTTHYIGPDNHAERGGAGFRLQWLRERAQTRRSGRDPLATGMGPEGPIPSRAAAPYRPGTIAVSRAAKRRESDAIARALSRTDADKNPLTILSHHYQTHIHGNT